MSDQLAKPLVGQYRFLKTADLAATVGHLGLGGVTATLTLNVLGVATGNAGVTSRFILTSGDDFTFTPINFNDGQVLRLLVIAVGHTTVTVTGNSGDYPPDVAVSTRSILTIHKFGSAIYVTSNVVVS